MKPNPQGWGTRPARNESVEGSLRRALNENSREILFVAHRKNRPGQRPQQLPAEAQRGSSARGRKCGRLVRPASGHSERSAGITSTRAARAAGSHDATTAAVSSTNAERITGKAPGILTSRK